MPTNKPLNTFLFCFRSYFKHLRLVSIGLEANFRARAFLRLSEHRLPYGSGVFVR